MDTDAPSRERGNPAIWLAAVLMRVVLGGLLCVGGAFYVYTAFGIRVPPLGDELGPRIFPLVVGSAFLVFSIIYLVREIRDLRLVGLATASEEIHSVNRAWLAFGAMALYCFLFTLTGYLIATLLFVLGFLSFLRFRGFLANALAAVLMAGAFYVVFDLLLSVPLPTIGW